MYEMSSDIYIYFPACRDEMSLLRRCFNAQKLVIQNAPSFYLWRGRYVYGYFNFGVNMSNYPYEDDELTHLFESIGLVILCPVLIPLMPLLIYDDYKNGRTGEAAILTVIFIIILVLAVYIMADNIKWISYSA